ncbi:hypothetical protein EXIGLDRAFT_716304 [Exidia glandulosa HHB12029]|uniref:Uncharacterized protein n=1 Tax=Exidia glandulosa HHB12029 TaxID=1314781 RepID=A0A165R137_EXIGL|nr:hypothetical protein EXIGLDRAFT_716304 [Exidia glandulosa HHB12029]
MHRVASLHFTLSVLSSAVVYDQLSTLPAPVLHTFGLQFFPTAVHDQLVAKPLPTSLFASSCPSISDLQLDGVELQSPLDIPDFLTPAKSLTLDYGNERTVFPMDVMEKFAGLRRLTIRGSNLFLPKEPTARRFTAWSELVFLELQCPAYVCDVLLESDALQAIPYLVVSGSSAFRCPGFMSHLRGDLVLRCSSRRSSGEITTTLRSAKTGHERTLRTSFAHFAAAHGPTPGIVSYCPDYSGYNSVLGMIAVANRVVSCEVSADIWHVFSDALMSLPRCSSLTFVLDDRRSLTRYMAPAPVLPCPALERVVLKASCERVTVRMPELARLLKSALPPSEKRRLVLENVDLEGDMKLLRGVVDIRSTSRQW